VAAARTRQVSDDMDEDVRPSRKAAPASTKRASGGGGDWADPFQDSERKTTNSKRGGASGGKSAGGKHADPASWKDPFTSNEPAAKPSRPAAGASAKSHPPVATRAPAPAAKTAPKVARPAAPAAVATADDAPKSQGRWGILKKRH